MRTHFRLAAPAIAALLLLAPSCLSVANDVEAQEPATEVYVLGMIHRTHLTSELWGLDHVRETIRSIDPDVVCVEIPPANWPGTLETWQTKGVVEDSRVRVFPEYVDVLMPLLNEMDFVVEPTAGWTPEMAQARRQRIQAFQTSAADAEAFAAYEQDGNWVEGWLDDQFGAVVEDDPFYIHSPQYDLRTKAELGTYDFHLNEVIGAPGGWTHVNREHYALIASAIEKHAGKRILITFGAGHKYWFLERLRCEPGVRLMDVRNHLPGEATLERSTAQAAEEAFLLGWDRLRGWWGQSREQADCAWQGIERMLPSAARNELGEELARTKGVHRHEFRDGPFLGPVQVIPLNDQFFEVTAPVYRLGDGEDAVEWVVATLVQDERYLGGFAWNELRLPGWLQTW